jgi:hypothetical protein
MAAGVVMTVIARLLRRINDLSTFIKQMAKWLGLFGPIITVALFIKFCVDVFNMHRDYLGRMCDHYRQWRKCCALRPDADGCEDVDWEIYTNISVKKMERLCREFGK